MQQRQREIAMEWYQEMSNTVFAKCDSAKTGKIDHKDIMSVCFRGVSIPAKSVEVYEATVGVNGTMNREQFFMWAMAVFGSSEAADEDDDQFQAALQRIIDGPKDAATLAAEARARRVQNGEVAAKRTTTFLFGSLKSEGKEATTDAEETEEVTKSDSGEDDDHENEKKAAQILAACFNGII